MKRKILGLILIALPLIAGAQTYGVYLGGSVSNIFQSYQDSQDKVPTKFLPGMSFGINVDYPLRSNLILRSGLEYITKGYATDLEEIYGKDNVDGYHRVRPYFLEVPIKAVYTLNNTIELEGGIYLGYGAGGRETWDYTLSVDVLGTTISTGTSGSAVMVPVISEDASNNVGANETGYFALDYGLSFGARYLYSEIISFGVSFEQSLSNFLVPGSIARQEAKVMLYNIRFIAAYSF